MKTVRVNIIIMVFCLIAFLSAMALQLIKLSRQEDVIEKTSKVSSENNRMLRQLLEK